MHICFYIQCYFYGWLTRKLGAYGDEEKEETDICLFHKFSELEEWLFLRKWSCIVVLYRACFHYINKFTDDQARHFLVCSICEMLQNVKTENFTLVLLRDHLVFTPRMTLVMDRSKTEEADENASSSSPGRIYIKYTQMQTFLLWANLKQAILKILKIMLGWFLHNIGAIMAKVKLPKKPLSMVAFWIKVRRPYRDLSSQADPTRENWTWSYLYFS